MKQMGVLKSCLPIIEWADANFNVRLGVAVKLYHSMVPTIQSKMGAVFW